MALISLLTGKIPKITTHIKPSAPIKEPFTKNEYRIGDIPSGAKDPKKTTPEIKWAKNFKNIATTAPEILWFLKNPATPNAIYGIG